MIPLLRIFDIQLSLRGRFRLGLINPFYFALKPILSAASNRIVGKESPGIRRGGHGRRFQVQHSLRRWLSISSGGARWSVAGCAGNERYCDKSCKYGRAFHGALHCEANTDKEKEEPEAAEDHADADVYNNQAARKLKNPFEHGAKGAIKIGDRASAVVGGFSVRPNRAIGSLLCSVNGPGVFVGAVLSHGTGRKSTNRAERKGGFYV